MRKIPFVLSVYPCVCVCVCVFVCLFVCLCLKSNGKAKMLHWKVKKSVAHRIARADAESAARKIESERDKQKKSSSRL